MHNYSKLEQLLHRLALASKYLREINFSLEKSIFLNQCDEYPDNHVFITGLARSGTTILLNALYGSNQFGSLTYEDMPFILAPNFWSKLNGPRSDGESFERFHADGIKITTSSPEAFEEVFWKTFDSSDATTIDEFITYVNLILLKKDKDRYLSKNNQNVRRISTLQRCFPKSKILIPFRDPLQHSFSLLTQHKNFTIEQQRNKFIANYIRWIGHSEFGLGYIPIIKDDTSFNDHNELNHWLEQWYFLYEKLLSFQNESNILYICYEDLCDNTEIWQKVKSLINVQDDSDFEFKKSIKDINLDYDKELYKTCQHTYKKLRYYFKLTIL